MRVRGNRTLGSGGEVLQRMRKARATHPRTRVSRVSIETRDAPARLCCESAEVSWT